jgi:hypothetical protein
MIRNLVAYLRLNDLMTLLTENLIKVVTVLEFKSNFLMIFHGMGINTGVNIENENEAP